MHNNLKHPTLTRPGFHLGAPKKHIVMKQNIFYIKYIGNPLPESCVGLFTTLCTGLMLKKLNIKLVFPQNIAQQSKIKNTRPGCHLGAPKIKL